MAAPRTRTHPLGGQVVRGSSPIPPMGPARGSRRASGIHAAPLRDDPQSTDKITMVADWRHRHGAPLPTGQWLTRLRREQWPHQTRPSFHMETPCDSKHPYISFFHCFAFARCREMSLRSVPRHRALPDPSSCRRPRRGRFTSPRSLSSSGAVNGRNLASPCPMAS